MDWRAASDDFAAARQVGIHSFNIAAPVPGAHRRFDGGCRVKMRSVWTRTVARCYTDDRSADPTTCRQPTWQPGCHDMAAPADHDADVVARHGEHCDALVAARLCQ